MQRDGHLARQGEDLEGEEVEARVVEGNVQQIAHCSRDVRRWDEEAQRLGD